MKKKQEYFTLKIFGLLLALIAINFSCKSNLEINQGLEIPSVFSDSMVLQQMYDTAFWGKSKPGETVTVKGSWGEETSTQSNEKGDWELKLSTPKAGGPYTITIQTSNNSGLSTVVATPVIRGEIIQVYTEDGGFYGSDIINFQKKDLLMIKNTKEITILNLSKKN